MEKRQTVRLRISDCGSRNGRGRIGSLGSSILYLRSSLLFPLLLLAIGCATPPAWTGPDSPAPVTARPWEGAKGSARVYQSAHYEVYSTLDDPTRMEQVMQVLEGALDQYRELTGTLAPTRRRMVSLLFATRAQWAAYTQAHGGSGAEVYLKIVRGGYTLGERFVAYDLGDIATRSVVAHEGWHQYVAHHFKGRLPPFLEEGFACMFENPRQEVGLPRWNLKDNPLRRSGLIRAVRSGRTWSLEELMALHAGRIVENHPGRAEAFYAQSWAFAMFLRYGENGRYRPALANLFRDTALGITVDPTGTLTDRRARWNPAGTGPMLEHYMKMPLARIEQAYWRYVESLVK